MKWIVSKFHLWNRVFEMWISHLKWNLDMQKLISFMELKQFTYEILFSYVKFDVKFLRDNNNSNSDSNSNNCNKNNNWQWQYQKKKLKLKISIPLPLIYYMDSYKGASIKRLTVSRLGFFWYVRVGVEGGESSPLPIPLKLSAVW